MEAAVEVVNSIFGQPVIGMIIGFLMLIGGSILIKIKFPLIVFDEEIKGDPTEHSEEMVTKRSVVVERRTVGLLNSDVEVPITLGWENPREVIGVATAHRNDQGEIVADMKIYHKCVETDKNKIDYIKGMYPSIGGKIVEMSEEGDILKFELIGISLGIEPNQDPTIKSL
jgi:hypothetical protein